MIFKIGDKVTAWGVEGEVVKVDSNGYVYANFPPHYSYYFRSTGCSEPWHKELTLRRVRGRGRMSFHVPNQ